ncbi:bifunctional chorismate mutase/prephenate dehydrogenase [Flocculibacter collagenilyticus]|uniref:bifunctional chorismate mutase/prephenate dehydrogenase n=1 Tax=Flocculibacter collagenilyticus TaxID=2744479 RepID=UPI0018F292A1|nr:bifunctional chorismate mutase/prephenate dehydrogenase [Flocculibacter collagenilyticus]
MTNETELNNLRHAIDDIDSELVKLLATRNAITTKIGALKSHTGTPIYVPERETELISKRRQEAELLGVSPDLIEDVLRRMMRESYASQVNDFKCINESIKKIVVIGGGRSLGRTFVSMLLRSGYRVDVLEKKDWQQADTILADANLVIVAVPIHVTEQVLSKLTNLPENCILADLTSTKSSPLKKMLEVHKGPVVGLHPMFGADVTCLVKQIVIVCEGRGDCGWLLQQIRTWGVMLHETSAEEHDKVMSIIQLMRHFTSFVYGNYLREENPNLTELLACSSPIYRLELAMVGRLFAQNAELYADIIFSSQGGVSMLNKYKKQLENALGFVERNDKQGFINAFYETQQWFGEYSSFFLNESRNLLLKAHDDRAFL